jgi:hypothetical protein
VLPARPRESPLPAVERHHADAERGCQLALTDAGVLPDPPSMSRRQRAGSRYQFGNAGWLAIETPEGEKLLVRVAPDESGYLRVRELHLGDTGEPVTAQRLRAVRLGAIENVANLSTEREAIMERIELPITAPLDFMDFFKAGESVSVFVEAPAAVHARPQPLVAPSGRGYPNSFYERVAEEYRAATRRQERPVMAVAKSANVPRSTAAQWVKETRRRRILGEAAAPGKAGDIKREGENDAS